MAYNRVPLKRDHKTINCCLFRTIAVCSGAKEQCSEAAGRIPEWAVIRDGIMIN
jgi:hypothetical protein